MRLAMDDEELFRQEMAALGVEPAPRREDGGGEDGAPQTAADDADDSLFLDAMESLGAAPDKDRPGRRPKVPELRKLKVSKSRAAEPQATLDLHGQTAEKALRSLERFVTESVSLGLKTILVITGKGLRSKKGVSVLKQTVEAWLYQTGKRRIRAFSEAPRTLGGRGAYVLYLR